MERHVPGPYYTDVRPPPEYSIRVRPASTRPKAQPVSPQRPTAHGSVGSDESAALARKHRLDVTTAAGRRRIVARSQRANGIFIGLCHGDQQRTPDSVPSLEPDGRLIPLKATLAIADIWARGLEDIP